MTYWFGAMLPASLFAFAALCTLTMTGAGGICWFCPIWTPCCNCRKFICWVMTSIWAWISRTLPATPMTICCMVVTDTEPRFDPSSIARFICFQPGESVPLTFDLTCAASLCCLRGESPPISSVHESCSELWSWSFLIGIVGWSISYGDPATDPVSSGTEGVL